MGSTLSVCRENDWSNPEANYGYLGHIPAKYYGYQDVSKSRSLEYLHENMELYDCTIEELHDYLCTCYNNYITIKAECALRFIMLYTLEVFRECGISDYLVTHILSKDYPELHKNLQQLSPDEYVILAWH